MSDSQIAARHSALTLAVQLWTPGPDADPTAIVQVAKEFLDFLNGDAAAPTSASAKTSPSIAPATKETPPKATKPASGSKSTVSEKPSTVSKSEVAEKTPDQWKAEVGGLIQQALDANKRTEALNVLTAHGGKSVTSAVAASKDLPGLVASLNEILLTA